MRWPHLLGFVALAFIVIASAGLTTAAWAACAVALLVTGFWFGFRGYRVIALIGLGCAIIRLFLVDIEDSLWRIIAFGVTGGAFLVASQAVGLAFVGLGWIFLRARSQHTATRLVDACNDTCAVPMAYLFLQKVRHVR